MNRELLLKHFDRISDAPDAIPRLREFILDLAVRGKLVENDPKDEPASELLKRIEAEKARLKTGKMQRGTSPPALAHDELPFAVPPGWLWTRIRQITGDRGQTTPAADFTYLDVTAINKEAGRITNAQVLSALNAPSRARKLVEKGDVLYSCVRPYLLNIAIVDEDLAPAPIASTAFAVLNGFGLVLAGYLWIVLRSPFMVKCVESRMRGQAYPAINDSDFALLPFPLPPLAEQRRIVAKVNELMVLCDRLAAGQADREQKRDRLAAASLHRLSTDSNGREFREQASFYLSHLRHLTARPAQVKQFRKVLLTFAMQGKLVPQDPNDEPASLLMSRMQKQLTEYAREHKITPAKPEPLQGSTLPYPAPAGWTWARLSSLFKVITDGDHQPPPKSDAGVAFLTIGNVTTGSIDFSNCRLVPQSYLDSVAPYRKPSQGDILYTVVGATYGRPVFVETARPFCVQRHIAILKPTSELSPRFLLLMMASPLVYDQATKSTTGSAQPTIPLRPLRNFTVPLPPVAEQRRIMAKVDELMNLCDALEAQLTAGHSESRRLLEAVLHEALSPATIMEAA